MFRLYDTDGNGLLDSNVSYSLLYVCGGGGDVYERERERLHKCACVCVCVLEMACIDVCGCVREGRRERKSVCVSVCVCVCECVAGSGLHQCTPCVYMFVCMHVGVLQVTDCISVAHMCVCCRKLTASSTR